MKFLSIIWMFLAMSVFPMFGQSPEELPLFSMSQLTYEGAFRISSHSNGVSNLNYNQGPIAYNYENHSLYIVGHSHHQAIAEYAIPEIVKSETLSELNMVETPIQVFSSVLTKTNDGNPQKINSVGGMYYVNHGGQAKLIVNGYEYYDAPADNTMTTVVIEDANAIETSQLVVTIVLKAVPAILLDGFPQYRRHGKKHWKVRILRVSPVESPLYQGPVWGRLHFPLK